MSRKRIVVLGASDGGYTAALALKARLRLKHDITLIARTDLFVFVPSLARLVLGDRTEAEASFSVRAPLAERGIALRAEPAVRLDLERRRVVTRSTEERYDFLIVATGARPNYGAVPGLGPRGYTHSVATLVEAQLARAAFCEFLARPGPVVIGDVQGAFGRAQGHELAVNVARVLRARGLGDVPLTHLTAGPPTPGDGFTSIAAAAVAEITRDEVRLLDGRRLPSVFSLLHPPSLGVDLVRACDGLADPGGFVRVNAFQQTEAWPEVFCAGAALAGDGAERSGESFERRALLVAENITACIEGRPMRADAAQGVPARGPVTPAATGWTSTSPDAAWADRAWARHFAEASLP